MLEIQVALIEAIGTIAAALLGAVAAVLTWFLTTQGEKAKDRREREVQRDEERTARADRVKDILTAIHAEITAGLGAAAEQRSAEPELLDRMDILAREQTTRAPTGQPREGGQEPTDPVPFAVPDDHDFVFEAVQGELTLLPQQVIHEVVLYYRQARRSNAMTVGLRDPILRSETSPAGQTQFVKGLLQLIEEQELAGRRALQAIEAHGNSVGLDLASKRSRSIGGSEHERFDRSGHVAAPRTSNISYPGAD